MDQLQAAWLWADKRQATLQCLIRPRGKQPKPVLLFRGAPTPKRAHDQRKRAEEENGYDPDCIVLWQAKAYACTWADTATCIEWAQTAFKGFVEEAVEIAPADEVLLLADAPRRRASSSRR